jgi:phenylacetic acid degradation operon negative regulatory protein
VALHRLRKEDWLESTKFGRESHYRLTENGRALSREAAPRIYGAASDEAWMLALYDPNRIAPEGLRISSGMILVASECAGAMNLAVADPLPLWMVDRLVKADVQSAIHNLHARLAGFSAEPDAAELDRAVLRLSLVHEWRRIILRVPDVPDLLFENAFSLGELRGNVQRLLSALSDVSLEQIIDS